MFRTVFTTACQWSNTHSPLRPSHVAREPKMRLPECCLQLTCPTTAHLRVHQVIALCRLTTVTLLPKRVYLANTLTPVHTQNVCLGNVIAFPRLVYLATRRIQRYWLSTQSHSSGICQSWKSRNTRLDKRFLAILSHLLAVCKWTSGQYLYKCTVPTARQVSTSDKCT